MNTAKSLHGERQHGILPARCSCVHRYRADEFVFLLCGIVLVLVAIALRA
jgi:hypothetical protein